MQKSGDVYEGDFKDDKKHGKGFSSLNFIFMLLSQ